MPKHKRQATCTTLASLGYAFLAVGLTLQAEHVWLFAKAKLASHLIRSAYAKYRADGAPHRPWRWADTHPIARLRVARLGVERIILAGATGESMAFGLAHAAETARPNQEGVCVLAGHRDGAFAFLADLRPGDEVLVDTRGSARTYVVHDLEVAHEDAGPFVDFTPGARLALVTCHPFGSYRQSTRRYIVWCVPATLLRGKAVDPDVSRRGNGASKAIGEEGPAAGISTEARVRMPEHEPNPNDPFSRVNYRSLIAWPTRIEREWPFLEWGLSMAPERSVIDLGCGTGEHARFLAARGYRALGIDVSASQIDKAREYEGESGTCGPRFIEGDMLDLPTLTRERFGAALCLGNVLPYMEDEDLEHRLQTLARVLLPGGRLLVQILNYARIVEHGVRHLPLNFRPDPDDGNGEIVWVRLMRAAEPGYMLFYPVTLRTRPGHEPPVEVQASREVRLRAWTWPELGTVLRRCGFHELRAFGDMQRTPYDASTSNDLIFTAAREA